MGETILILQTDMQNDMSCGASGKIHSGHDRHDCSDKSVIT